MTLSPSIYIRRNGPMVFWRMGRLGGSFYLASSSKPNADLKAIRKARKAERTAVLRAEARMWRRWGQFQITY